MYSAEDIIITLPKGTTMFDINYLSVYSEQNKHNMGHISFDITKEKIPPALGQTKKPGWWFDIPTQRLLKQYLLKLRSQIESVCFLTTAQLSN